MSAIADIGKKRGRPVVGSTGVLVKLPPDQLDALDAWIRQQDPQPSRPEAMRRILTMFINRPGVIAPSRSVASPVPPFDVGDRVTSRTYGAGTVVGPITAIAGADPDAAGGVRHAGWNVPVHWDAAEWGVTDVRDFALTRIGTVAGTSVQFD